MRELLKAAETVVDEYKGFASPHFHSLLVKLEEAIAAAKERSKWVKVADGLPVVPNGEDYAEVWVVVRGEVREDAFGQQISEDGMSLECGSGFCSDGVTHWKYKYTPAPPEEA